MPASDTIRLVHSIDSRGRTISLRSSSSCPPHFSNTGGMKPSSLLRSPSTVSPTGGSTAHTWIAGFCSLRKRPTPISVPLVPSPARRPEEHTSELQSRQYLVCRLLRDKKKHRLPTR